MYARLQCSVSLQSALCSCFRGAGGKLATSGAKGALKSKVVAYLAPCAGTLLESTRLGVLVSQLQAGALQVWHIPVDHIPRK